MTGARMLIDRSRRVAPVRRRMFGSFVEPLDDPLSGRQLRLRLPLGGRDRSAKGVVLMPVVTPVDGTPDREWIEPRLGDWSTSFDADPINR